VLSSCDLIAFVSTTDADRALQFYGDTLGLPLVSQSPVASIFQANGTMLRVTVSDKVIPAPYTVLGWAVTDIVASIPALRNRGVKFLRYQGMDQDDFGIWNAPGGGQIAWFKDPDGNILSLTQF
jgi:catechol 2,3-dioxygenase-like lactoylglutathione lyase family enzyme